MDSNLYGGHPHLLERPQRTLKMDGTCPPVPPGTQPLPQSREVQVQSTRSGIPRNDH